MLQSAFGAEFLYNKQIGFGLSDASVAAYLKAFYTNDDSISNIELEKVAISKLRRLSTEQYGEDSPIRNNFQAGSLFRTFEEAYGQTKISESLTAYLQRSYEISRTNELNMCETQEEADEVNSNHDQYIQMVTSMGLKATDELMLHIAAISRVNNGHNEDDPDFEEEALKEKNRLIFDAIQDQTAYFNR